MKILDNLEKYVENATQRMGKTPNPKDQNDNNSDSHSESSTDSGE
jgi:hypothetical protein